MIQRGRAYALQTAPLTRGCLRLPGGTCRQDMSSDRHDPIIGGFSAFSWDQNAGKDQAFPALVGLLSFVGLFAVWYVLYQFIEFPRWMAWFH